MVVFYEYGVNIFNDILVMFFIVVVYEFFLVFCVFVEYYFYDDKNVGMVNGK